jgi:hypothetical protein
VVVLNRAQEWQVCVAVMVVDCECVHPLMLHASGRAWAAGVMWQRRCVASHYGWDKVTGLHQGNAALVLQLCSFHCVGLRHLHAVCGRPGGVAWHALPASHRSHTVVLRQHCCSCALCRAQQGALWRVVAQGPARLEPSVGQHVRC